MQRTHLMIGMPRTGKSTFIAALYHVVESGQVSDSLQLVDLGEDRKYLVELRDQWLGCEEFDRTKLGEEQVVTLKLRDIHSNQQVEVVLPDASGEDFRDQWEQRKSSKKIDDLARQADGVLLFVHPDTVKNTVRINKNKLVAAVLADEDDNPAKVEQPLPELEKKIPVEWKPEFSPTQVKLVELLQFLMREPDIYPISRIVIVISAWDIVKDEFALPSNWMATILPLLDQFLKSNSDRFPYKLFGLSAQGAPYCEDNKALHSKERQADRIEIISDVHAEYGLHDISAPIKWLMKTIE